MQYPDMPPTQYRPSRRNWIKLWTHEWLTGTLRWQLNIEQRSMWADLLALAGDSRFPGIVTPGEDAGKFIGYPAGYFVGLFRCSEAKVKEAFEVFERQNRIRVGDGGEIHIVNWDKYQSEYQEKRQRKQYKRNSAQVTANVPSKSARLESEVEGEVEVDGEVEKEAEDRTLSAAAWTSIYFEGPFGHSKFQTLWLRNFKSMSPSEYLSTVMERTIQECGRQGIKVPPQFFEGKREVEKQELAAVNQSRVPL